MNMPFVRHLILLGLGFAFGYIAGSLIKILHVGSLVTTPAWLAAIPDWIGWIAPSALVVAYWIGRIHGFRMAKAIAEPALARLRGEPPGIDVPKWHPKAGRE